MADEKRHEADDDQCDPALPAPVVAAKQLFGDHREICIDFEGVRYRLRITRRNKLILQK